MGNAFLFVLNTITDRKVITAAPKSALLGIMNTAKTGLVRLIAKIPLVKLVTIPQIFVLLVGRGKYYMKELV
jgi:hypothetical protein